MVVVGSTSTDVVYDDPWDGVRHFITKSDFQRAWGTASKPDQPFQYLAILSDEPLTVKSQPTNAANATVQPLNVLSLGASLRRRQSG